MVKTIFMPIGWQLSKEEWFLRNAKGTLVEYNDSMVDKREKAEAELSEALNEGYTLLSTGQITSSERVSMVFVLHKPD